MTTTLLLSPSDIEARRVGDPVFQHACPGTPFTLRGFHDSEDKPGHWSTLLIAVERDGRTLGGYHRLYGSFGQDTFAPFQWDGVWYALYAAHYTCTRVMRLTDDSLEDWCGEEPSGGGFCPTAYFLPQMFTDGEGEQRIVCVEDANSWSDWAAFAAEAGAEQAPLSFPGFGFLAGCHWGDDTDWKLRYVDYRQIQEKVLRIDERFGYHPLPTGLRLAQCVDLSSWDPEDRIVHTHRREFHRLVD